MLCVTLRFYGDLNDLLLVNNHKGKTFERRLPGPTSVKDLIEGCGAPHTEVDLILANGKAVEFSYLIEAGDRFSIYPFFNNFPIPSPHRLQPKVLDPPLFLADVNLGKLARYLRMAGFDTVYHNEATDDELIEQMQQENRALLSRDRKLLMRKVVRYGYLPRSHDPVEQLQEVLKRFKLNKDLRPFSRCPKCNGMLREVAKEQIMDQLEPLTKKYFHTFSQCPDCGQIYWAGSHRDRLDPRLQAIFTESNN